MDNPEKLTI